MSCTIAPRFVDFEGEIFDANLITHVAATENEITISNRDAADLTFEFGSDRAASVAMDELSKLLGASRAENLP